MLADLLCVIAVGLADESDGIRQMHMWNTNNVHLIL